MFHQLSSRQKATTSPLKALYRLSTRRETYAFLLEGLNVSQGEAVELLQLLIGVARLREVHQHVLKK